MAELLRESWQEFQESARERHRSGLGAAIFPMTNPKTSAQSASAEHTLPPRYREAKVAIFDELMPSEWLADVGQWLFMQRGSFWRGGDEEKSFHYELLNVDELHAPFLLLKKEIVSRLAGALESFSDEPMEISAAWMHASLHHHGSRTDWQASVDELDEPRIYSFCFFLHSNPTMFSGGEIEFVDGTTVSPGHNRLVIFDARQEHRIRRVECWSAEFLHGRWAVFGWMHGKKDAAE